MTWPGYMEIGVLFILVYLGAFNTYFLQIVLVFFFAMLSIPEKLNYSKICNLFSSALRFALLCVTIIIFSWSASDVISVIFKIITIDFLDFYLFCSSKSQLQ